MKFMLKFLFSLIFLFMHTCSNAYAGTNQPSHSVGQEFVAKAQTALIKQLQKQGYTKLKVTPKSKQLVVNAPLAQLKVQIKDRYPPLKQICVRLNDGKHSYPIWFKVKAYQKVLVAKHVIKSRTLISSNDFILENQNVAGLSGAPYRQIPSQRWLKKPLSKGSILTEDYLSTRPDIVKGQSVQVRIKSRSLSINTEAIAEHDAYLGQAIKIRNTRSNKLFMAVVNAPNQVEVHA